MGKIRYLVGKGTDRKFKRNVPKHLLAMAGKTAWVERVRSHDAKNLKRQGSMFALFTESEIARLERQVVRPEGSMPSNPGSKFLSHELADEVAIRYFADEDRKRIERRDYLLSEDDPDLNELIDDAALEAQSALRAYKGEETTAPFRALDILLSQGVIKADDANSHKQGEKWEVLNRDRAFRYLCRRIEQADLALAERRYASLQKGELVEVNDRFFRLSVLPGSGELGSPTSAPVKEKTVSDLSDLFLRTKEGEVSSSRFSQFSVPFRILSEKFGPSTPLHEIDRAKCRSLVDWLPTVPAYLAQHHKGFSIDAAIERDKQKNRVSSQRFPEAQKTLQILNSVFQMAVDEGWLAINPWVGLRIKIPAEQRKKHADTEGGYEPFTIEQLNRFFALPLFTGCQNDEYKCHTVGPNIIRRHRYWAPIIALWSGMRMNEILQLEKEDIKHDPEGIRYFDVNDTEHQSYDRDSFTKRLKTKQAVRRIPIHPALEQLGFVDWVDGAPAGRLFPEAKSGPGKKPSDVYSKRFASNLKAAGIWKHRRLVFHSFRNNFNDAMRVANVPVEIREAINGWSNRNAMDARYGHGYSVKRLFDEISKVQYPGLRMQKMLEATTQASD